MMSEESIREILVRREDDLARFVAKYGDRKMGIGYDVMKTEQEEFIRALKMVLGDE